MDPVCLRVALLTASAVLGLLRSIAAVLLAMNAAWSEADVRRILVDTCPALVKVFPVEDLLTFVRWLDRCDASYSSASCTFAFVWVLHGLSVYVIASCADHYVRSIGTRVSYP